MNVVQIEPTHQIANITFRRFAIQHVQVYPFFDAYINVIITDDKNDDITKTLHMTPDEYKQWGADDDFLIYWIANKFGFQITDNRYLNNPFYNIASDVNQTIPPPGPNMGQ